MSQLICPSHTGFPWYSIGVSQIRTWLRWLIDSRAF